VILAILFRGAIFGLFAWLIGLVIALLSFLFSLGFWGFIVMLLLCAFMAALT
jgi:hypothetical protein